MNEKKRIFKPKEPVFKLSTIFQTISLSHGSKKYFYLFDLSKDQLSLVENRQSQTLSMQNR